MSTDDHLDPVVKPEVEDLNYYRVYTRVMEENKRLVAMLWRLEPLAYSSASAELYAELKAALDIVGLRHLPSAANPDFKLTDFKLK